MYDERVLNEIMGRYEKLIDKFCSENNVPLQYFAELSLQKHPVQVVSSRMYTILSKDMQKFISTLYQVVLGMDTLPSSNARPRADYFRVVRVMCWDKDKKQVVLFPNLPADAMGHIDVARRGHSYYQKENPYFPSVSMAIQNEIADDLKCEHRQKRWLPVQRGIARLKKRQVTTLGRALANYLECFCDKSKEWVPIKDQQWIEVVATRMLSITKPPTLHFASGKKGFRRMYVYKQGSPSSCMDSRKAHDRLYVDGYANRSDNKNKAFVENVQPVDWYGDCPVAFGMYMKRAGVILARGIYYRNPKTKQRVATRVYGVTSEFQKLLIKEMRERGIDVTFPCGYSVDKKQRIFDYDIEWSVPTHMMGGSRVTPFPYFDWHPFRHGIFARKKDDFTWFLLKNDPNTSVVGFDSCNLAKTDGYFCDDMVYMEPTDMYYCSEGCAVNDGHRLFQTGTNIDWRNYSHEFYNDTIHDFQDCVYFSNRLNCLLHGNVLTNTPWALPELDTWKTYQRAFSHRNNYDIVGDTVYDCGVNVPTQPDRFEYRRLFHTVMYEGTRYDVTVASFSNQLYNRKAGHNFLIQSLLADKHFAYRGLWMEAVPVQHISDMKHVPMVKGLETITNLDVLYEYEQELESQFDDLPREGSSVKAFDNLRDAIIKKETN